LTNCTFAKACSQKVKHLHNKDVCLDNSTDSEIRFDVFELIRLILKHRNMVIAIVVLAGLAAVVYSLLTPQIWRSDAAFYAVSESNQQIPLGLLAAGNLGEALMEEMREAEAMNCVTIMTSRSMSEAVIRKFGMVDYFRLNRPDSLANLDDAIHKLDKLVKADYGDQTSLITLAVETKSKRLSRDIADYYISSLDSYLRDKKVSTGKRNRMFLEARIGETRHDLDSLMAAIQSFQSQNRAIDLSSQSAELIKSYSDLLANKMNLDIRLELARANYGADSPLVKDLELQTAALARQITGLENGHDTLHPKYQLDMTSIPGLQQKYTLLQLDLAVAQKVLDYLQPQYEAAKLDELRNLPSLEMLDRPREPGKRVRPKRALICVITVFMAFCLAVLLVVIKEIILTHPHRLQAVKDALHASPGDQA